MDWSDEGVVLAVRKHGETAAIVSLLTRDHGRHAGLVRGGVGRRARGTLQPGNEVQATWRARLAEHLGAFTCELVRARAARLLDDPPRLAGLAAACALAEAVLPEREPHNAVWSALVALLERIEGAQDWPADYVRWELGLLADLGFGLDLSRCAVTGACAGLAYVSPRTGRAVSEAAAGRWRERLLALPGFLAQGAGDNREVSATPADIAAGLALTGFFLETHVLQPASARIPAARQRLVDRISGEATTCSGIVADE